MNGKLDNIPVSLGHVNAYKMKTESAVKSILIDDMLYKYLPL